MTELTIEVLVEHIEIEQKLEEEMRSQQKELPDQEIPVLDNSTWLYASSYEFVLKNGLAFPDVIPCPKRYRVFTCQCSLLLYHIKKLFDWI